MILLFIILSGCHREEITSSDDGMPPSAPIGLLIYAAFDGQIGLSWQKNNEPDIYGYNIYRSVNDSLHFQLINFVTQNYYIDQNLDYDIMYYFMYYYKITSVDKFNRESSFSIMVSAQPKNIYKPLRPQYVKINARNLDSDKYILINWSPSPDNDIHHYEIYRSTADTVKIIPENLIDTVSRNFYIDNKQLNILTKYSYSIVAIDKGGLKSQPTNPVSDIILNKPVLIYPPDNSILDSINKFEFIGVSRPTNYKLVIQSDPAYGIVYEYDFYTEKVDTIISIKLSDIYLQPYRTYYWRIFTFTQNSEPNSMSDIFTFTYNSKYNF